MGCFFDTLLLLLVINCSDSKGNSMIMYCVVANNVGGMGHAQTILLHAVIWFQMSFWKHVLCIIRILLLHMNHIRMIFGYNTLGLIKLGLTWGRRRRLRWTCRCRCWCCLGSPCYASGWPGNSSPPGSCCCQLLRLTEVRWTWYGMTWPPDKWYMWGKYETTSYEIFTVTKQ